jgi:hypothetical protein
MRSTVKLIMVLVAIATITSCKKDPEPAVENNNTPNPVVNTGSLTLEFKNMVGNVPLVFDTLSYVNEHTDTFTISLFRYYISNIVLTKSDGSYTESNSYHLVDASDITTESITLKDVPYGNYTSISFMIGIDSAHNVSGAQAGDLDPAKGMFWSWNTGYIMAKIEGTSPQSTAVGHSITYHIGGFKGPDNPLKTVTPSFGSNTANVSALVTPQIFIKADVSEWFKTPNTINFSSTNDVAMPGSLARSIADNYADMFSITNIHN